MSLYSDRLVEALGLVPMHAKGTEASPEVVNQSEPKAPDTKQPNTTAAKTDHNQAGDKAPSAINDGPEQKPINVTPDEPASKPSIHIEKNEYRLLIKMLQAIDHACEFDRIEQVPGGYVYKHPNIDMQFTGLSGQDDARTMHLATLAELIANPALKRPVWEKLKTIKS